MMRPDTVGEALACLSRGPARLLAGGTDLYASGTAAVAPDALVDLGRIAALRGIGREPDGSWRIGALTTWADLLRADLPPAFDALRAAAAEVGGVQIQNVGTVGGNLCNASPAADGVPPLLALDAQVELLSPAGARRLALDAFLLGPRRTALQPGELLGAVLVPAPGADARAAFLKLGARRYLVISIAMVAVTLEFAPDPSGAAGTADPAGVGAGVATSLHRRRIARARIAVGACSPVARRLAALEARLAGTEVAALASLVVAEGDLAPLAPLDDPRASRAYRLDAAAVLVRRALVAAAAGAAR